MPTSPNQPDGSGPDASESTAGDLARIDPPGPGSPAELVEEERLVRLFEQLLIRHEEVETGPALSPEQIDLALQQQEEHRRRLHERAMLRETHRHELALARQREESEQRLRQFDLRRSRLTFLPRIAVGFGAIVLLGTALILYLLVSNGAKEQIPVVLAFLSGIVGGILAGFGGGFATAKLFPPSGPDSKAP